MAVIVIKRSGNSYNIMAQSVLGPATNVYRFVGAAQDSPTLSFQATISKNSEAVSLERSSEAILSEEQVQLLSQYDWTKAPSWATYAAVNSTGAGTWFSAKPDLDEASGCWAFNYADRRNWPMYSTVKVFRGWRGSLVARPTGGVPEAIITPVATTPGIEGTIFTDAISYIEAGLGNMQVVPEYTYSSGVLLEPTVIIPEMTPLYASVSIEVSNDAITWSEVGALNLSPDSLVGSTTQFASWPYIRAKLVSITGTDAFVTVDMSV